MTGGYTADLLALLAGLALPLAFAPFGWQAIAILSQALLYHCVAAAPSPRRAFRRGWLYGLGMFGAGVSWVQVSVHQFGLPVLAFSAGVTVLLVAFLALYPALFAFCARRWFDGNALRQTLLSLPLLWTLVEWLRGWLLTGFPWLALGYSQIDSPLAAYAPVLGVYGTSLMTALTAGAVAALMSRRWIGLLPIAVIWAGALVLARVAWTQPSSGPLPVAVVQAGIEQGVKWDPAKRQMTLERYFDLTAPHWGARLILWPETALPAFYSELAPYLQMLDRHAKGAGSALIVGMPYDETVGGRYTGHYYNSVLALGRAAGRYDKRHLVPFGEFMPLEGLLAPMLRFLKIPMSDFSAGARGQAPLFADGLSIGVSICYEDAFGEEVIDALPQAALLVNVSNDAWFGDSIAPHQHLEIARMRALETGRYLLRATNTGVSAIIDARGKVMARSPQFAAHALAGEVRAQEGATPYVRFGNWPVVIALAAGLLALRVLKHPLPRLWGRGPG